MVREARVVTEGSGPTLGSLPVHATYNELNMIKPM